MDLTEGSRVVLDLLIGESALVTVDAWELALSTRLAGPQDDSASERDATSEAAWLRMVVVDAVDTIVPHLSDYKTFYENLSGLLKFCEQECCHALFNVMCKWLAASMGSAAFRRWLFAYAHGALDTALVVDMRQWKQALLAAALQERDERLKRMILKLIDRRIGSLERVVDPVPSPRNETVRLLIFYYDHSEKLTQSSTLCAAKLMALSHETMVPSEEVLALLRWGRILKPPFFDNLVDDLLRLQALRRPAELELQVPRRLASWFQETESIRVQVQHRLEASQQQMHSAQQHKTKHIYSPANSRADWIKLCSTSTVDVGFATLVVSSLRRDLTVLPSPIFSHVFAAFATFATNLLQENDGSEKVLTATKLVIDSLFGLVMLRGDSPSLLLVLAVIIDLQLASFPVWHDDAAFFRRHLNQLSDSVILEMDSTKKWVLQMALHQLVLECDVAVLLAHAAFVEEHLPHETYTLARLCT